MKRLSIILFVLAFSSPLFSQSIKTNQIDDFTGNKVVITDWETIRITGSHSIMIRFHSQDTVGIMQLSWVNYRVCSVEAGPKKVLFKLSNNEVIGFENLSSQLSSRGGGTVGLTGGNALGLRLNLYSKEMDKLVDALVTKIRIYSSEGTIDLDITEQKAQLLRDTYRLFLNTQK